MFADSPKLFTCYVELSKDRVRNKDTDCWWDAPIWKFWLILYPILKWPTFFNVYSCVKQQFRHDSIHRYFGQRYKIFQYHKYHTVNIIRDTVKNTQRADITPTHTHLFNSIWQFSNSFLVHFWCTFVSPSETEGGSQIHPIAATLW